MAKTSRKVRKTGRRVKWTWQKIIKPTGSWIGKSVIAPGARRTGRGIAWSWNTAWKPERRQDVIDRVFSKIDGEPKWAIRTADVPTSVRTRRKRWQNPGSYSCMACGHTAKQSTGAGHKCDPLAVRRRKRGTASKKHSKTAPRKPKINSSKLPPVRNSTRGARIVRAGTASERFAFLSTLDPNELKIGEFEQLIADISHGLTQLAVEIGSIGEEMTVHPKVKDQFEKLSSGIADQVESAREIRRVFRREYRALIRIATELKTNNAPPVPNDEFFDDLSA